MMHDSVREELEDKIVSAPKPLKLEIKPNIPLIEKSNITMMNTPKPQIAPQPPAAVKTNTTEIAAKATSPTLVEFQNKNATLPEWRLQLQNAVRKRMEQGQTPSTAAIESVPAVSRVHLPINGSAALKAEVIEEIAPAVHSHPKLADALQRIEASRKRFLAEEVKEDAPKPPPAPAKNYPFYIATKNAEVLPKPPEIKPAAPVLQTPVIEDLPIIEKTGLDTNKLRPLPNAAVISTNLERVSGDLPKLEEAVKDAPLIKISRMKSDEDEEILELEDELIEEENEDLAPLAMRFNSGVFDLLIGAFTSLILLAPFMISGGNWVSIAGFLAFLVTCAIVMFIYLTTAIGMFGKTVGMKIFSLETIDIEENDYPTFHQAAVSSSVYLVSLALGGIGFIPALFNSERRTAPDLLSGTIIVKE